MGCIIMVIGCEVVSITQGTNRLKTDRRWPQPFNVGSETMNAAFGLWHRLLPSNKSFIGSNPRQLQQKEFHEEWKRNVL